MKEFFKVTDLDEVLGYASQFPCVGTEAIPLMDTAGRILAEDLVSDADLPGFARSTMDGYAVRAQSTFGASEGNPAYINVVGAIAMGDSPDFSVGPGEAAKISTGGMLPDGADSVVMVEYTGEIDDTSIEIYKSIAPGQHVVEKDEDFSNGEIVLSTGQKVRPQETGLLAAFGSETVQVFRKPVVGIISTGDEVVPVGQRPGPGHIRDINSYTLSGLVKDAGGIPVTYGIVRDDYNALFKTCSDALEQSDMVIISGGSSVGTRDFTIEVLSALADAEILAHGISISPGKPTIFAKVKNKIFWGLPGHVVSAMVVFEVAVKPFIKKISGLSCTFDRQQTVSAVFSRNIPSVQGRVDFVRVRLIEKDGGLMAEPVLGKSGLINTMVKADGLVEIDMNTEGLDKGTNVDVMLLS